jgi:subtilisin family serine protease
MPIRMETMSPGLRLNRRLGRLLVLVLALAAQLPAGASALPMAKDKGPLSPLLDELARPAVAAKSPAAQAALLGVADSGPASLVREGGRIVVTARFEAGAIARLSQLRSAGARIVSSSREQQTVTLSVAPADLAAVAAITGIRSIWEQHEPIAYAVNCEGGAAVSEGLTQLRVDEAREAFALRGKGLTVGVLSDSFDAAKAATSAEDDVLSGDLPGPASSCSDQQLPVDVLDEAPSGSDEGRAMLQIVHDLAPKAGLAFATAFKSEESFAQNIERLAEPVSAGGAGADVIVDDVAYFEEPFFQDGPVAVAVGNATAAGASYFSAAGNDNLFDSSGREIASWEAPAFRDSNGCPEAIANLDPIEFNGSHCMDFDPGGGTDRTFGITVEAGRTLTLDLQWAEPWNGVTTDLDAFLLSGGSIVAKGVKFNFGPTGTQRPVEIFQWKNSSGLPKTVQLAINRFAGSSNPRLKFVLLQNGGGVSATEYPESNGGDVVGPTIFGHAGAASAISVAAVPYDDSTQPEPYSSRGPVTHYFGPVEGVTPALPLGSPEVVAKPDLAATDCGVTTFFAFLSAGVWRFCGTSAAAPHAAAVAALVRQAKPAFSQQQVRETLTDTAAPVGAFTPPAIGAGLVDAFAAIGSLPAPIEGEDGPSEPVEPVQPPAGPAPVVANFPSGEIPTPPAPNTLILRRPPKLVRTHRARARVVFRFGSDQARVTFLCKVDAGVFHACDTRIVRRLAPGRHVLKVKARNAGGLVDATPVVFRFRIERT